MHTREENLLSIVELVLVGDLIQVEEVNPLGFVIEGVEVVHRLYLDHVHVADPTQDPEREAHPDQDLVLLLVNVVAHESLEVLEETEPTM